MGKTKRIDPNAAVGSPCRLTSSWAFIGYHADGTTHPLGVYSSREAGTEAADIWLRTTEAGSFAEGYPVYEEMTDDV